MMPNELSVIVNERGAELYQVAWRILAHAADVDDVLQDAVLEAIQLARRENIDSWIGLLKRLIVLRSLDPRGFRREDSRFVVRCTQSATDNAAATMIVAVA